jgi:hypothetical protein
MSASINPFDGTPSNVAIRSVDGKATTPGYIGSGGASLIQRIQQYAPTFSGSHWTTGDRIMLSMLDNYVSTQIIWTDLEASTQTQGTAWDVIARMGDSGSAASATFNHAGTTIAYMSGTGITSGMTGYNGRIFTVPYNNRAGGMATPLAGASDSSYVQYYPVFSADDAFIAFDRIPAGQYSYNNAKAEVFVVPSGGGSATRTVANDPPACLGVKSPGITNSWPKWSPSVATSGGLSYYFLVFSSTRDPNAAGGQQLYVAPMTVDAMHNITTYPALYLWNQPEMEHNHTPAWDVFQLPGPN